VEAMRRLALLALLLWTAFLLTACPLNPPPPPASTCSPTPTGSLSTQALREPQGLGDFSAPHVPGELLVLPGGLAPQSLAARVQGVEVRRALDGGFLQVKVPPGQEKAKAKALLQAGARWVQPNYLYFPLYGPTTPISSPDTRLQPYYQAIRLEAAWDLLGSLPVPRWWPSWTPPSTRPIPTSSLASSRGRTSPRTAWTQMT
jgi:serine protease